MRFKKVFDPFGRLVTVFDYFSFCMKEFKAIDMKVASFSFRFGSSCWIIGVCAGVLCVCVSL